MQRRKFLKNAALASSAIVLPWQLSGKETAKTKKLRFGLIADIHQDVMHDGAERLKAFIDESNNRKMDFVMQLGDFC